MFQGTFTALITPFRGEAGTFPAIDYDALAGLVEWQLDVGVDGLVVCGTTGESATLSLEEKLELIDRVVKLVGGRVPVIAGTGTNSTRASVELTAKAKELGADGALVVSPYYNKPNQEGLFQHFAAVAKEGGLPVVLYNIPSRTSVEISFDTFRRLREIDNIVAVKQAVDSAERLVGLSEAVEDKIAILAGDCSLTYAVLSVGGKGVISASSNVIPEQLLAITRAGLSGDMSSAFLAQQQAFPAIKALFLETNPAPAKAALKLLGRIPNETLRLPMVPVTEETRKHLAKVLGVTGS